MLAAAGPNVDREDFPESARLVDLAPTILAAAEAPASVRHGGSALPALVGSRAAMSASGSMADRPMATGESGLSDREAEEVEEHLRGLGYLE